MFPLHRKVKGTLGSMALNLDTFLIKEVRHVQGI